MSDATSVGLFARFNTWGKIAAVVGPIGLVGAFTVAESNATLRAKIEGLDKRTDENTAAIRELVVVTQQLAVTAAARDERMGEIVRRLDAIVLRLDRRDGERR